MMKTSIVQRGRNYIWQGKRYMNMSIFLKYLLAWLPMMVIAVGNGTLRDLGYKKYVGELIAHQVSTLTLIFFLSIYVRYIVSAIPPASSKQALFLGIVWLLLTLSFEFGLGLARGRSWASLLADYDLLHGRLWLLVPVFITIAPYIFLKLR